MKTLLLMLVMLIVTSCASPTEPEPIIVDCRNIELGGTCTIKV